VLQRRQLRTQFRDDRAAIEGPAAVSIASTFGSIWRKRSSTATGPMSAAHIDQIAPSDAVARNATTACGTLGR
jgi:hypothetical protein